MSVGKINKGTGGRREETGLKTFEKGLTVFLPKQVETYIHRAGLGGQNKGFTNSLQGPIKLAVPH